MRKRKVLLIALALLTGVIVAFYTGTFTPYNLFTAQRDAYRGKIRFVTYGLALRPASAQDSVEQAVRLRYGFAEENIGCLVSRELINGITIYNAVMERCLERRNGRGWRQRYEAELAAARRLAAE